jgi:prepilin-type N-terminal cleavage/methylation domain-containing protein
MKSKGFTLIELIVVIAIIAVMSGIILFSITQYISRGKDANVSGNLAILVTAGEAYYNIDNSYNGFCNPIENTGNVFKNIISQMPDQNDTAPCYSASNTATTNPKGVCCKVAIDPLGQAWAACARKFTDPNKAFCVDSRGIKKDICVKSCTSIISVCPDDDITECSL